MKKIKDFQFFLSENILNEGIKDNLLNIMSFFKKKFKSFWEHYILFLRDKNLLPKGVNIISSDDKDLDTDISKFKDHKFQIMKINNLQELDEMMEDMELNEAIRPMHSTKANVTDCDVDDFIKNIKMTYRMNTKRVELGRPREDYAALFIWGAPGIGKTSIVNEIAKELDCKVMIFTLSQIDAADFRGLSRIVSLDVDDPEDVADFNKENPSKAVSGIKSKVVDPSNPENEYTVTRVPALFPADNCDNGKGGIFFFDEFNRAPKSILSAALTMVLNGKTAEYELPSRWIVIAAGNRPDDLGVRRVALEMEPALANRFFQTNFSPTLQDFINYAEKKGSEVNPDIIEFFRTDDNEQYLHQLDNEDIERPWPSQRSWSTASYKELLLRNMGVPAEEATWENPLTYNVIHNLYMNQVGPEAADAYVKFLKEHKKEENRRDALQEKLRKEQEKKRKGGKVNVNFDDDKGYEKPNNFEDHDDTGFEDELNRIETDLYQKKGKKKNEHIKTYSTFLKVNESFFNKDIFNYFFDNWTAIYNYFAKKSKHAWEYYALFLQKNGLLKNETTGKDAVKLYSSASLNEDDVDYLEDIKDELDEVELSVNKNVKNVQVQAEVQDEVQAEVQEEEEDAKDIEEADVDKEDLEELDNKNERFYIEYVDNKEMTSRLLKFSKFNEDSDAGIDPEDADVFGLQWPNKVGSGPSAGKSTVKNVSRTELYDEVKNAYLLNLERARRGDNRSKLGSLFIWGAPGVGKTSILNQIAKDLDIKVQDWYLSQVDRLDIRGLSKIVNIATDEKDKKNPKYERTVSRFPAILPRTNCENNKGGILFFDELNRANHLVLSAAAALFLDGKIGDDYILPSNWIVVAAGNRYEEIGSSYITKIEASMSNRFTHVNFVPTLNEWISWSMTKDYMNPQIIEFLQYYPKYFHRLNKSEEMMGSQFPTPRSWAFASQADYDERDYNWDNKLSIKDYRRIYGGLVGKIAANKFIEFIETNQIYTEKDIEGIFNNPKTAKLLPKTVKVSYYSVTKDKNGKEIREMKDRTVSGVEFQTAIATKIASYKKDEPLTVERASKMLEWLGREENEEVLKVFVTSWRRLRPEFKHKQDVANVYFKFFKENIYNKIEANRIAAEKDELKRKNKK